MEACELLAVELRIDRIEAELASELPPHLRTFAHAHARGLPAPPAPDVVRRAATLATARAALAHPVIADRGLALLRLAAPIAIESDPAVIAARAAPPTWEALSALAAARDAAAAARFGRRAIEVMHRLHGSAIDLAAVVGASSRSLSATSALHGSAIDLAAVVGSPAGAPAAAAAVGGPSGSRAAPPQPDPVRDREVEACRVPAAVAGWFEADGVMVDDDAIARAWEAIRTRHGVDGTVRFERATGARPRAFVIEPGREIAIAIPERIATPAARFAVLHELGHAIAGLALLAGIPRVLDEAIAAYVATAIECDADAWYSPLAGSARARRLALARVLDRIERGLPELPAIRARPAERPPWALWHDPGAQAAYVAAEPLAEAIEHAIGASPAPGGLAAAAAALREPIDRLGTGTYAI